VERSSTEIDFFVTAVAQLISAKASTAMKLDRTTCKCA